MNNNEYSFDGQTTSSDILWSEILCRIPFVKKETTGKEKTVRIKSKNEVEEEDAMQLEQWIQNQEVILCHSSMMQQEHCRGIVENFEYLQKSIKVTVSSDSGLPIWEDTDIWMYSLSTPSSSLCTNEPNTSVSSDPTQEEQKTKPLDMDQAELFQSINGWKLVGLKRQRMRRKYDNKWKNVYLTELEMISADSAKTELLKHVKEGSSVRLSDDIDEVGDVFLNVLRATIKEGNENTITLGVTGFARRDVDISLSKESTFYLNIYDGDDDDLASIASEEYVLPGYSLEQNVDELCEKIGKLTISDVCIKTWFDVPQNYAYIRLVVTSATRKMHHFKLLCGYHVIIQSSNNQQRSVLAVVSRVMKDGMILTLKGVRKNEIQFFFSKMEKLNIQIDHNYEQRLRNLQGKEGLLEELRRELVTSDSDIRLHRSWKVCANQVTKHFASFTSKNAAFNKIPHNAKVLLGKCWEVEGQLERKADFVFAVRVTDPTDRSPSTVTFEVKYTRNLIRNSRDFELTKAFYYVDLDSTDLIAKDDEYCLLNARNYISQKDEVVTSMFSIGEDLKFFVFPHNGKPRFEDRRRTQTHNEKRDRRYAKRQVESYEQNIQLKPSNEIHEKKQENKENKKNEEQSKSESIQPPKRDAEKTPTECNKKDQVFPETLCLPQKVPAVQNQWKVLQQLNEKHKPLCHVYIHARVGYALERDNPLLQLRSGYDAKGQKIDIAPWQLGRRIVITAGVEEKEIKIKGDVHDTKGEIVIFLVDKKVSDMEFISNWNCRQLFPCFEER